MSSSQASGIQFNNVNGMISSSSNNRGNSINSSQNEPLKNNPNYLQLPMTQNFIQRPPTGNSNLNQNEAIRIINSNGSNSNA